MTDGKYTDDPHYLSPLDEARLERDAALERAAELEAENAVLREAWAEIHNTLRHQWWETVEKATETLFRSMSAAILFSKIRREKEEAAKRAATKPLFQKGELVF